MNPYMKDGPDWYGLYRHAFRDDVLFPKVRVGRKREGQAGLLLEAEPEQKMDPTTHPAKMSPALLRRILAQMQEWGWIGPGSVIVDPFGGTGQTGVTWCALDPSNRAVTIEIEPHFVEMERQVKAHAERNLGRPLRWEIIQGDSRKADEYLRERGIAVTSPPYGQGTIGKTEGGKDRQVERLKALTEQEGSSLYGRNPEGHFFHAMAHGYIGSEGNIDLTGDVELADVPHEPTAAVSSPPYADSALAAGKEKGARGGDAKRRQKADYATLQEPMNIGLLPDAALTSPPFEDSLAGDDPNKRGGLFRDPKRRNDRTLNAGYTQDQVAAVASQPYEACTTGAGLPDYQEGPLANRSIMDRHAASKTRLGYGDASVSSPPFEAQSGGHPIAESGPLADERLHQRHAATKINEQTGYADNTDAQIGSMQSETYADACEAVYCALARAGVKYVALVTKNPTRNGKLRRLDKLTCRLMRRAGYRVVGWKRAWLFHSQEQVEALTGQGTLLDGGKSTKARGRISFFRRIHMAKGGVAAAWEDVIFGVLDTGESGRAGNSSPPYMNDNTGGPLFRKNGTFPDGTRREVYGDEEGQIGALPYE